MLRFYGPVNPMGSCRARSVYLTTRLLGRCFCPYLFLISPSFGASGRLCFVIVAFSGYLYLYFYIKSHNCGRSLSQDLFFHMTYQHLIKNESLYFGEAPHVSLEDYGLETKLVPLEIYFIK